MDPLQEALHLLRGADGPRYAYHKPSPEQIAEAERNLGKPFPPTFERFLRSWDGSTIDYWEVLVLEESLDEDDSAGLVETNLGERENGLPEFLIAFHPDGHGGYFCFDSRAAGPQGEYRIFNWHHDLSAEENLAALGEASPDHGDNFADWLLRDVKELAGADEGDDAFQEYDEE